MKELTQNRLKELLVYDKLTGVFTWKVNRQRVRAGAVAGCVDLGGYRVIFTCGKQYKAHRLAWLYIYGNFPGGQIDHINHIKADNRIINLRDVSQLENGRNQKMFKNNTSGVIGVCWCNTYKKWIATISTGVKRKHLGLFRDFSDACEARAKAEIKYEYHDNHGV